MVLYYWYMRNNHHTDDAYTEQLLQGWEEVFKKGQLTLWVLLALYDGPKHMAEIRQYVAAATNDQVTVDDVSLYRALRRYYDNELTDVTTAPGKGPDKKIYSLTPIGTQVLRQFVTRNIVGTLYKPEVKNIIERITS